MLVSTKQRRHVQPQQLFGLGGLASSSALAPAAFAAAQQGTANAGLMAPFAPAALGADDLTAREAAALALLTYSDQQMVRAGFTAQTHTPLNA